MNEPENFTVASPTRHELRVKRSLFIGSLSAAKGQSAIEDQLNAIRREFYDATHNCFAYRIDKNTFRYSDDGEPSGTAGKPILSMLEKYELLQSLLVVTRYYGGVKLGTGGLLRAYSQCAEETIQKGKIKEFVQYHYFKIHYPYNLTRQVHYILSKYNGAIESSEFETDVRSEIKVADRNSRLLKAELMQSGAGQIKIL